MIAGDSSRAFLDALQKQIEEAEKWTNATYELTLCDVYNHCLDWYHKHYPKAAKKKRIRNKWKNSMERIWIRETWRK